MKFTQKAPCAECPYVGKMPGFIGGHEHPQEFHDVVRADAPFPCHMSVNACGVSIGEAVLAGSKVQHCVGYMLYMNRMIKSSRRPDCSKRQVELKSLNHLALDPFKSEVVTLHLDAMKQLGRIFE